jgi:hypothetical protein
LAVNVVVAIAPEAKVVKFARTISTSELFTKKIASVVTLVAPIEANTLPEMLPSKATVIVVAVPSPPTDISIP